MYYKLLIDNPNPKGLLCVGRAWLQLIGCALVKVKCSISSKDLASGQTICPRRFWTVL